MKNDERPATQSDLNIALIALMVLMLAYFMLTMAVLGHHFDRVEKGLQPCQIQNNK